MMKFVKFIYLMIGFTFKILFFTCSLFLISVCSHGCAAHTEQYHPCSEWEVEECKKANFNIFPDDVRNDLNMFLDTVVAWPGIIKTHEYKQHEDRVDIELILEHHYYDWLEDYGMQKEKIFLSPQGEGLFSTTWALRKDVDLEKFSKTVNDGDLALVYGYPDSVCLDSTIAVRSTYIRSFPGDYYSTDFMDYGRVYRSAERDYLLPRKRPSISDMCCVGGIGIVGFAGLASLSFLSFGDEVLGVYWACGAVTIGASTFTHEPVTLGPALTVPMALGLGALSYYDFAYGDERSDTEVFLVNALGPVGITAAAVLSGILFPKYVTSMSKRFSLQTRLNSIKISMGF